MSTTDQIDRGTGRIGGKHLAFTLSNERYAVDILTVQEIIGVPTITRVPRAPEFLKGVINLRGKIIPIVDLRIKFGLPPAPYDERTCIIVVNVQIGTRTIAVGVAVDTVLEVTNFKASDIEPAPDYGNTLDTRFITGMGRTSDKTVTILIDIQRALADSSKTLVQSAAPQPATIV